MSIKFYETEVPVMSDTKKDEDRSTIVPYASGAEPYRGSVENTNSKGRGRGNKLKILLSIQERSNMYIQGSYRSWKTWKVMELKAFILQAWKDMEFNCRSLKDMEN